MTNGYRKLCLQSRYSLQQVENEANTKKAFEMLGVISVFQGLLHRSL